MEHSAQDFAYIAILFLESLRHAVHQSLRWIVGNKAHGQLARNELSGGRMMRQNIEHPVAFLFAALINLIAQNIFRTGLMSAFIEAEAAAKLRLFNAPARKDFGQLGYVFLGVAAVNSQRVQLHNFTGVIFIESVAPVFGCHWITKPATTLLTIDR